jgi:hypothetical protein
VKAGAVGFLGLLVLVAAGAVSVGAVTAQPAKPSYLPYAEFAAEDTPQRLGLKRSYNEAVQRYNQTLYEYYVALEQHDRLVEAYNGSADSAARKKNRDEAEALRAKLGLLRREATTRAAAVDEAARRAAAAGLTLSR